MKALPRALFRYSPVVIGGGFAFVSGLIGIDPASGALAPGGAYAQARQVLDNLRALAAEQGFALDQLVMARLYVADFTTFAEVGRAWDECFQSIVPPARSSLGVAALPLGALVEMEFQFLLG